MRRNGTPPKLDANFRRTLRKLVKGYAGIPSNTRKLELKVNNVEELALALASINTSPRYEQNRETLGDFFTLTTLAEELGVDRQTARVQTIDRGCPATQVGREKVFTQESFVQWLRENERRVEPRS